MQFHKKASAQILHGQDPQCKVLDGPEAVCERGAALEMTPALSHFFML